VSGTRPDATEGAQLIAAFAATLSGRDLVDLRDGLGILCRAQSGARVREARFGLLVQMIDGTGEVPRTEDYDRLRAVRVRDGEQWPDRAALTNAYGHWLGAVRAAMTHWHVGTPARTPHTTAHLRHPTRGYRPEEAASAIRACRDALAPWPDGVWPTEWEYTTWVQLQRRAARHAGRPYPRLAGMSVIRRLFGDYPAAVRYTAAATGERPRLLTTARKRKPLEHGTMHAYGRGCRCQPCRQAKRDYRDDLARRKAAAN
jgi:hypothetical protein